MDIAAPQWLSDVGPDSDVALATRCRLARNLDGLAFPWRADERDRKAAAETILDAARRAGGPLAAATSICGERVTDRQAAQLLQWQYASRDWMAGGTHRWLLIAPDRQLSLLVNEEDHIRVQAILPGVQVESAYGIAADAERRLAASVVFADRVGIGFLSASLTNAGTGLRISVLLHLAGLAASETRHDVLQAASEIGCAIRGLYGEGTFGTGELFQVSNIYGFGLDPIAIAERVAFSARYLVEAEREARARLFRSREGRARLRAATAEALRQVFREEAAPRRLLPLVSILRLAIAEGVLKGSLAAASEWISLAGVEASEVLPAERAVERFEAVRRTAALRQRLRTLMRADGTFHTALCGL